MQPQSNSDYKKIFTELIGKQIIVLGPDITLAKVKNVAGIEVNDKGEVINIQGDAQHMLQLLINQFVELSGAIVKKTMESILMTYPGMTDMASGSISGNVSTPPSQVAPVTQPQDSPSAQSEVMGANPFSDAVNRNSAQVSENTASPKNISEQLPKEEMDSINKALSELSSNPSGVPQKPLENNPDNVQQSNDS